MSESELFCPKCGSESTGDIRYCRRCGTNLEVVTKAMLVPALADDELARAQRAFRMGLVRGLGLLVLAAGSGKALVGLIIAALAFATGPLSLWAVLGLILFGFVPAGFGAFAVRDLLHAYELKKDPRGALSSLPSRQALELAGAETRALDASRLEYLEPPASVAENTTRSLDSSTDGERNVRRSELE